MPHVAGADHPPEPAAGFNQAAIVATRLSKSFGSFRAVTDLSVSVETGTIYGFLGPNGSGKSTVIRMLCGLLTPTSGRGSIVGYDCVRQSEMVKRSIGYMSQKFSLYPDLTVSENLGFYGRVYEVGRSLADRRDEVITLLGLKPYFNRRAGHLSGGWKQRLALGCALLHRPKVLFLDEPTAGIDPVARRELWDFLFRLASEGTTLFVTTHYMDEAERCGNLGYIYYSRLLASGRPDDLKRDPRVTPPGTRWLEAAAERPAEVISRLVREPGLDNVTIFGNTLHLRAWDSIPASRISEVSQGLEWAPGAPTLEDVFVMLTYEAEKERRT